MLPTTLVTLATFLLELSSSSPVYNMQPAFITNTVGVTTGRNIRNLPCISRRNLNQNGVCMFAIDCLKANGTHLGTCIDRFYFGSCCHIEPIHEIFDNSIDTDIIPHREPPMRIANTTHRPISTPTTEKNYTFLLVSSSTNMNTGTTTLATTKKTSSTASSTTAAFGQRVTTAKPTIGSPPLLTTIAPETSTLAQKLQTFQVVDGNTLDDLSTKSSVATTKVPSSTLETVTKKPIQSESATSPSVVTSRPTVKPSPRPTTRPATRSTSRPKPPVTGSVVTKAPTTKPTKSTSKPTKYTVTTRKPQASSTAKVTKKPTQLTKPTKRISITTKRSTIKPVTSSTTTRSTTKSSISTTSLTTSQPNVTTVSPPAASTTINNTATVASVEESTRKPNETTTKQPVLVTTLSNEVIIDLVNTTTTINGNPATNEIEGGKPVGPVGPPVASEPTDKPGLVTWTVMEEKGSSTTPKPEDQSNITSEWVPITTPDGWVLLPSVAPVISPNDTMTDSHLTTISPEIPQTATPLTTSSVSLLESSSVSSEKPTEHLFSTESSGVLNATTVSEFTEAFETEMPGSESPSIDSSSVSTTTTSDMSDRPVNMSDFTHVCGRRMFPEARIVGGEKSLFGKWPWQISLRQWRTSTYLHKCGAALLNENWAITAAHCVDNVPPSDLLLRLGEHDLSTESEPYLHQERRVQIVASHPQFDPRTFEYDLALLRFYEPVVFQPNILPVCVPQTDENFVGRTAWVTGWGRLYEDGPLPSILQEVSVPVINNTVCESMYRAAGYIEHIPHIFICAGWRRGGFDSCEGDSGGPMVIQRDDNRFLLAGVISWGIGCAEPNQPGVYTRISEFKDWINQILQF